MSKEEINYWWDLLFQRRTTGWRNPVTRYNNKVHLARIDWDRDFYSQTSE
jgi:hypothetical protein